MDPTPLASLSLTHVHYNPSDPLSHLCAWLALLPQAFCVIYATLIWSTREIEILLMFIGQMGCEVVNFGLKRWIKEERPREMNGKGYGMPSSHAQYMSYFSLSLTLFLLLRHHPTPTTSHKPLTLPTKVLLSTCTLLLALLVSLSRIYLNYHTPNQVLAGCIAGAISAMGWFGVTEVARRQGWVEWGLEKEWVRWGRWRDLVVEEDLVESGWRVWEERRKRRRVEWGGAKKER